ncbi:helix-turn-helix domain-containing protein [Roseateles sp. BYS78W]|uniref:Helix-turn-helix domain-containing protein n=1 Tax=Pelomonas candidula TaxID=3299025 RepID=A0ABW7HK34_9BURK
MEHSEFRLFVALCRFRGRAQLVNPSQETLAKMTGMARNNVSRAANRLQDKGWVRLHHRDDNPRKAIENYELLIPTPGVTVVVPPKPTKARAKPVEAAAPAHLLARPEPLFPSEPLPDHLHLPDSDDFDAMDDDALYRGEVDIDSEPMSATELYEALTQLELQEA